MKHDFILHIGANKTGSSAIQSFIRANLDILDNAGFVVPDPNLELTGRITGDQVFAFQKFVVAADVNGLSNAFAELKAGAAHKTILCSAENLSNPGRHQAFAKAGSKYNIKVILYIRRQDELISSSWQQWQSKVSDDFNGWLIGALQSIGHWERVINAWEGIVGPDNVTVRVFERESFPDGNIMLDFLECLGIDHSSVSPKYPEGDINPSFNDVITGLVAGNTSIFKDTHDSEFYKMIYALTGSTYIERKKYSLMSRGQREQIVKFFDAQNERIRQKYFPNRDMLFKPVDHSKYRYLSEAEVALEQNRIMMHLLYAMWQQNKG